MTNEPIDKIGEFIQLSFKEAFSTYGFNLDGGSGNPFFDLHIEALSLATNSNTGEVTNSLLQSKSENGNG